tara:strand:+ start:80 stop:418 length:339 start_codon:yes stop_codon:yes gene_type:complete
LGGKVSGMAKKRMRSIAEIKQAVDLDQPLSNGEKYRLANHLLATSGCLFDGQPRKTPVGQQHIDAVVFHHEQGSLVGMPSGSLPVPVQAIVHEWCEDHPDWKPDDDTETSAT